VGEEDAAPARFPSQEARLKIIAEDFFHRPSVADKLVAEGIMVAAEAEVMRRALQENLGERESRMYRVVGDDYAITEGN
jgi:hypothetical protein